MHNVVKGCLIIFSVTQNGGNYDMANDTKQGVPHEKTME